MQALSREEARLGQDISISLGAIPGKKLTCELSATNCPSSWEMKVSEKRYLRVHHSAHDTIRVICSQRVVRTHGTHDGSLEVLEKFDIHLNK